MTSLLYSTAANYTYNVQQSKEQKLYMYLGKQIKNKNSTSREQTKNKNWNCITLREPIYKKIWRKSRLYISHFYLRNGVAGLRTVVYKEETDFTVSHKQ
jgi:hypothetical protein